MAQEAPVLGQQMFSRGMVIRGRLTMKQWRNFLVKCAKALGMSPVTSGAVWKYPIDGKGGVGATIVQPLTESFLALDTWDQHDGAYLFICSCKAFSLNPLCDVIAAFGLRAGAATPGETLRLCG